MDKKVVFFLLLGLFIVVGCKPDGGKNPEDFRTGSKGLVLSFLPNSPPSKFIGDSKLDVAVQIKNEGTSSIENSKGLGGNIYLSGYDANIIRFEKNVDGINLLNGRSAYDPQGEIDVKEFPATVSLSPGVDTYKTTILATACYSYETVAIPMVCIDPDPYSTNTKQKACSTRDISLSSGQGAPVAVSKVELSPSAEKLRFNIHISNIGGGLVFDKDSQNCNPYSEGLSTKERNIVTVEEVRIANINLLDFNACKPLINRKITLINNQRSFLCELDIASSGLPNSAFTSPLVIRLKYGYTTSISKNIEIIRPPQ